jgi:WD40 repeat protein
MRHFQSLHPSTGFLLNHLAFRKGMGIAALLIAVSCGLQPSTPLSVTDTRMAGPSQTPTVYGWSKTNTPTRMPYYKKSTPVQEIPTPQGEDASVGATSTVGTGTTADSANRVFISPYSFSLYNAGDVAEITRLGGGNIYDFDWSPSGNMIAVANARGVDFYFSDRLDQPSLLGYPAKAIVFLPDIERMAMIVGSEVYLVRRNDGAVERKLAPELNPAWSSPSLAGLYISPKGTTLIGYGEAYIPQYAMYQPFLVAWNTATGKQIYLQESVRIHELFFSPDGALFSVQGELGMCVIATAFGQKQYCQKNTIALAFTADGDGLLADDRSGELILMEAASGDKIRNLESLNRNKFYSSSRSRDGIWAVLYSDTYEIWNLESVEKIPQTGDASEYSRLLISPDGSRMLGFDDAHETLKVVNLDGGAVEGGMPYQPGVSALLFPQGPGSGNPGNELWVQYSNGDIRRWRIDTQQSELKYEYRSENTGSMMSVPAFQLSPNGRWLAIGDFRRGETVVYDRDTMQEIRSIAFAEYDMSFSPNGRILAWMEGAELIQMDLSTGNMTSTDLEDGFYGFRYADSQTLLGLTHKDLPSREELWDMSENVEMASMESELDLPVFPPVDFSPDGRLLVVADNTGLLAYNSRNPGTVVSIRKPGSAPDHNLFGDGGSPWWTFDGFAVHPFVPIVATRETGGPVRLWNADTGVLLVSLTTNCRNITRLAFGADGRYLAGGCGDGTVYIWGVRE